MASDSKIQFSEREQNALAMICEMMSHAKHESRLGDDFDTDAVVDSVARVLDSFLSVRWDDLYDRFHRQGVNR
jgi:hypothetical protein